jgi:peptidoglycan/LPS O-acetylase OafA/YrhL
LTGLRAFAALWVFAYHFRPTAEEIFPNVSFSAMKNGFLGVDVFFVLSGFVLSLNYGGRTRSAADYRAFIRNRIARIYPLHMMILLILIGFALVVNHYGVRINHPEHFSFDHHLLLHAFLIHAWGFENGLRWNIPSWSISAEFFAYLLFGAFYWIASRASHRGVLGVSICLCVLTTVVLLRVLGHETLHVASQHVLIRVSGEFLAGCLVYRLYELRSRRDVPGRLPWSLIVVGVLALALSPYADPLMPWAACLLVYALACDERGVASRIFAAPVVVWLGTISYSIYLTHLLLISVVRRVVWSEPPVAPDAWTAIGITVATLLFVVGASAASYYVVEAPARRWLRSRSPQGKPLESRRRGRPSPSLESS